MEIINKKRFWGTVIAAMLVLGIATASALSTTPTQDTNQPTPTINTNNCGTNCTACLTGAGKCNCGESCGKSCGENCGCAKQPGSQCGCGK